MHLIDSGEDFCVISVSFLPEYVVKIEKCTTSHKALHEAAISEVLRVIDPAQVRFVAGDEPKEINLSYISESRALYRCVTSATTAPEECNPDTKIWALRMIRLSKIENFKLTDAQMEYLLASVSILHANNISHGDIHISNIMFNGKYPVFIDWSTAKLNATQEDFDIDYTMLRTAFSKLRQKRIEPVRQKRPRNYE